ncbi:hypothetical protein [Actinacidiphila guanduensis]|nr:hypothetical protein [Actinacidiphila guanduensis]
MTADGRWPVARHAPTYWSAHIFAFGRFPEASSSPPSSSPAVLERRRA